MKKIFLFVALTLSINYNNAAEIKVFAETKPYNNFEITLELPKEFMEKLDNSIQEKLNIKCSLIQKKLMLASVKIADEFHFDTIKNAFTQALTLIDPFKFKMGTFFVVLDKLRHQKNDCYIDGHISVINTDEVLSALDKILDNFFKLLNTKQFFETISTSTFLALFVNCNKQNYFYMHENIARILDDEFCDPQIEGFDLSITKLLKLSYIYTDESPKIK